MLSMFILINTEKFFLLLDYDRIYRGRKKKQERMIKLQFQTKPKFYHKIYNNSKQRWLDLTLRSSVYL